MTIKVFAVESAAWNANKIKHSSVIGEFADEGEALTEIWRDLVLKRQHRAYLIFRHHPWLKFWLKPVSIVWGGLHKGMPRIYQEPMDIAMEKKAAKLKRLAC